MQEINVLLYVDIIPHIYTWEKAGVSHQLSPNV